MTTTLIRNGQLVGGPFNGLTSYDVNKLSHEQAQTAMALTAKARDGKSLSANDITDLMRIRKAAAEPDACAKLTAAIEEFKRVMR